jgi:HSP20 family protein
MSEKTKGNNIPVTTSGKSVGPAQWASIHPISDMAKTFEEFFGKKWPSLWDWKHVPSVDNLFEFDGQRLPSLDVINRDAEVVVKAEVPGFDKKDISISIADGVLTIKGETKAESKEEKGDYYKREISSSSLARSISLPSNVDESKVIANLKNGILEIKLPKSESSKARKIEVR